MDAKKNHAWVVRKPGGPDHLTYEEMDVPVPHKGEALIRLHYGGVGFTDRIAVDLNYFNAPPPPFVPGYEFVGTVERFGEETSGTGAVKEGTMVAVLAVVGAWQEWCVAPVDALVPLPEGTDPIKAIALILNYVTAYQLIHREAIPHHPGHGDDPERQRVVLFTGASGGVGLAFLELVQLLPKPWKVYGTASASKKDLITSRGAIAVDYAPGVEPVFEQLRRDVPDGFDFVFDSLGGPWASHGRSALRSHGKLICFGVTANSGAWEGFKSFLYPKLMNVFPGVTSTFYGITLLYKKDKNPFKEDLGKLFVLMNEGKVKPLIDSVVPLAETKQALAKLVAGKAAGKIVVTCM